MSGYQEEKTKQDNELDDLVAKARHGDQTACRELYDRHKSGVFTLALRLAGERPEAEDLVQEIFVKAFRGLDGYRGNSSFSTWMYRIAVNCCRDRLRQKRRHHTLPLDQVEVASTAGQRQADLGRLLEQAITKLPEGCREVFVLHDVQGMGHTEIAGILGCSEANVRSQLWKARGRLREMIAPHLESEAVYYEVPELDREAAEPAG